MSHRSHSIFDDEALFPAAVAMLIKLGDAQLLEQFLAKCKAGPRDSFSDATCDLKTLLNNGLDADEHRSLLALAIENDNIPCFDVLIRFGADINDSGMNYEGASNFYLVRSPKMAMRVLEAGLSAESLEDGGADLFATFDEIAPQKLVSLMLQSLFSPKSALTPTQIQQFVVDEELADELRNFPEMVSSTKRALKVLKQLKVPKKDWAVFADNKTFRKAVDGNLPLTRANLDTFLNAKTSTQLRVL